MCGEIDREGGFSGGLLGGGEQAAWESLQRSMVTLAVLANMCDDLGPACFKRTSQILQFVQVGQYLVHIYYSLYRVGQYLVHIYYSLYRWGNI